MATQRSLYTKRRHHRNGGESKNGNGHRAPVQIDGRTIRGLSNGDIRERNVLAANLVRGHAEPVNLSVAQVAALTCTTVAGVYDALRRIPA